MTQKALRILLVHHSAGTQSTTRELLLQTDLVPFELDCMSPNFAGEGFRRNHYNVCIVDAPGKGIQLLEESLRLGFATPIITLISDSATEVLEAMRHGAADCLIRETLSARALEESICIVMESAHYREYESECAGLYMCLVEHSSEIIFTHDLQGNSTFINKAGQQLTEYTLEEASNMNFRQILSPECGEAVWRHIERMLDERRKAIYETVMVSKEGKRIPVSVTMHLIYKEGNPVGVQGIARELSLQVPGWSLLTESEQTISFLL
jgi:PAS domain S-box-containing protein